MILPTEMSASADGDNSLGSSEEPAFRDENVHKPGSSWMTNCSAPGHPRKHNLLQEPESLKELFKNTSTGSHPSPIKSQSGEGAQASVFRGSQGCLICSLS